MPDAPLSRRARRALEAQAAERAAGQDDPARESAEGVETGEIPAVDSAGRAISRRDRRRLERLARPMESWTAEEEMIATGQIPAMTPERIAEQERLAREAAERSARDAQTASQELRILAQRDLERQRSQEAPEPPKRVSGADVPLMQPAPRADESAPLEEREIVEPYSPRFELDDRDLRTSREESADVQIPADFDPHATIERTPAPTGEPGQSDDEGAGTWPENLDHMLAPAEEEPPRPSWDAQSDGLPAAARPDAGAGNAPQPRVSQPEQAADDSDEVAAARAKVFEELFPPGSSQAALLEHDRRAQQSAAEAVRAATSPDGLPYGSVDEDDEEAERQRGIEEIRRLTEAAISGMERKPQPAADAQQSTSAPQNQGTPQPENGNRYEMPADSEQDNREFLGFRAADAHRSPASPMPNPGALAPPSGQFPTITASSHGVGQEQVPSADPAPHQATFDEAVRTASTEIPVRPVGQQPQAQGQAPSQWDHHPLDAVKPVTAGDVDDFEPISDVPRPDFSQLNTRPATGQFPPVNGERPPSSGQFPTTSGQFPTASGQFPTTSGQYASDPTATGQIAPIRRVPDLPPVGGASHFRWHHLAVIGALVFVLGVVIYNVTLGQ